MKTMIPAAALALSVATLAVAQTAPAGAPAATAPAGPGAGPGGPRGGFGGGPGGGFGGGPGGGGGGGARGGFGGGRGGQQWPITLPANPDPEWPVADGAQPARLGDGFKFTEGATSDKDGDIYFVDQNSNRIHKFTFDKTPANKDPLKGEVSIFMEPTNYSNGMCFDNDWNLITCADEKNELWKINVKDKSHTTLVGLVGDKPLNGPNDVWVVPAGPLKGGMYITDPLFARSWWTDRPGGRGQQQPGQYVYFLKPDLKTLVPVVTDMRQPNGIIGTADGKTLYVADMGGGETYKYTIKDDGTLADKKPFCAAGSDGMTIDDAGNIYTTSSQPNLGVQIWNKDGKRLGNLPIGSANICIGGKDHNVLFINSQTFVTGLLLKTHGIGPQ